MSDTIFALATARGKAGVSVFRVSGPEALAAAKALGVGTLSPRQTYLRKLTFEGVLLDEALVIYFAKGASFTGEEVVEFQTHGSLAVNAAMLRALGQVPGLRLAAPGEFTRRALENGCLDLTQVEGLADLIDAETEAQRKQAQRVLSGAIGQRAEQWRKDLIRAAALIEATIDFADEEVPVDVSPEVLELIDGLRVAFRKEIDGSYVAERIRDGFEVAIIGPPNAGKSSLLNCLAGREAAITSSIAGTTRDVIEVRMELAGLPVTLLDTAGLRETDDEIEKIGVDRARQRAAQADLRVLVRDDGDDDQQYPVEDGDIIVWSKADIRPRENAISAQSGIGIDELIGKISATLSDKAGGAGLLIRQRQRQALSEAVIALDSSHGILYSGVAAELAAADLRSALRSLELLVGQVGVEALLGEIFSSFCIGK